MKLLLKRIFGKYLWIGLIFILISIILNMKYPDIFIISIIANCMSTIGVAFGIGSIFDLSKNSQDFIDFVSNVLKDIIISRNFLKGLEDNEKKKALEMILTPSGNQLEQYSDIEMYFRKKIDDAMEIFHTNFKTNLVIDAIAVKKEGIVQVNVTLTYRVYKIEDKYFPLVTTFERDGCFVEQSFIISPDGKREIKEADVTPKGAIVSPTNVKTFSYEIPEDLYKFPYLTIKKIAIEKGHDHWTNFHWNTLTPADEITFSLKCYDDLHIQEYFIFDDEKSYDVTESDDKKILI